ncbi:carbohydrate ABC transporter permease [Paenibacillus sp. GCM10027628]|uniref:carbohydrate ABC transporter permease n=1 Tax=Paenibacillus sp. GCM10027628 TaxID=3273413 RepID=UPI00363A271E
MCFVVYRQSFSRKLFVVFNILLLTVITLLGIIPFIHLLSVSLSSNTAAMAGEVKLWPVGFSWDAYLYLGEKVEFFRSLGVSIERVILGTAVNMLLVFITAYPLAKTPEQFRSRTPYVWFFAVTMFFGGGLIPSYIIVKNTGLLDSIWALILPGALNVWNMVLMLNFFRAIPKELEEAATIDGAGHWRILWQVYLPVSLPSIATIGLFTIVGHWNSWFDGILYMNSPEKYPLQTYLSTLITAMNSQMTAISAEQLKVMENLSEKTLRTAQIFMGALPIMVVYPFLQKYFVKGMTVGSVKE